MVCNNTWSRNQDEEDPNVTSYRAKSSSGASYILVSMVMRVSFRTTGHIVSPDRCIKFEQFPLYLSDGTQFNPEHV